MEQDKMKKSWAELNDKLNKSILMNEKLLQHTIKTRRTTIIQKRINYNRLCVIITLLAALLMSVVIVSLPEGLEEWKNLLFMCEAVVVFASIFNIAVYREIYQLRDKTNIKEIVISLLRYRRLHKYWVPLVYSPFLLCFPIFYYLFEKTLFLSVAASIFVVVGVIVEIYLVIKSVNQNIKSLKEIEKELETVS